MAVQIINQISPKLEQFIIELNTLMDKYQYDMVAQLEYQNSSITPVLKMIDVPPKNPVTATPMVKEEEPTPTDNLPVDGGTPNGS